MKVFPPFFQINVGPHPAGDNDLDDNTDWVLTFGSPIVGKFPEFKFRLSLAELGIFCNIEMYSDSRIYTELLKYSGYLLMCLKKFEAIFLQWMFYSNSQV